jgi:hypothetical protein
VARAALTRNRPLRAPPPDGPGDIQTEWLISGADHVNGHDPAGMVAVEGDLLPTTMITPVWLARHGGR